uniref:ABC transporter domain-containing protein n=1 Tax=Ictidomys tridecemlineatus TaxID=43179 RepID=I3LWF6_ICTTR
MSSSNDLCSISMSQRNSDDLPETTSSDKKGPVLSFHNVSYHVKEKKSFPFDQKTTEEKGLWNINRIMKPGLNAIVGHQGRGKSLLLDILAARKEPRVLYENVWVHEVPHPDNFQCNSGYVVQDDIVMSTLTVRENMWFSASLRLPTTMSKKRKNKRIKKVIEKLGLCEVADSKVICLGMENAHGERKLISIGMELILDPSILFLNEPTTGLDWNTAYKVIKLLKSLSEQGPTIIFSIYHSQYSIVQLFDSLTILASGKLMYHGPAKMALEYFKSAGYSCEHYVNPVEVFFEIINGIIKQKSKANNSEMPSKNEKSVIEALADFYTKSSICGETKSELQQLSNDQNKKSLFREEISYVTSFGHQLIVITWRSFQNLVGRPQPWIAQRTDSIVLGPRGGRNNQTKQGYSRLFFVLFFCFCFFSHLLSQVVYMKINLACFGGARDTSPLSCYLPTMKYTIKVNIKLGKNLLATVETFFIMIFTLMMVAFSSISMSLAIGINHNDVTITRQVMNFYFTFMLMIGGLPLYLRSMAPQILWLQYFSIPYYGFTALQHNEFWGRYFCPALSITCGDNCPNYVM